MIVTVMVDWLPREIPVPVGLLRVAVNVSSPSTKTSLTMGTEIIFDVSPAANLSVPSLMV
jgi:hypothetical protein